MRQIKNCKVGHFVKYNGVLCQVNCFFTNFRGKCATLIQVGQPGEDRFVPAESEMVHEDFRQDDDTFTLENKKYAVHIISYGNINPHDIEDIDNGVMQADTVPCHCRIEIYERVDKS